MNETVESLSQKIEKATELESVVSTMKALAASHLSLYETALTALVSYFKTIELGLLACIRKKNDFVLSMRHNDHKNLGLIVFGSDQGLVGQFNDSLAQFVVQSLKHFHGNKKIWTIGERMKTVMQSMDLEVTGSFEVPSSVPSITPLIQNVLNETDMDVLYVFNNTPTSRSLYNPSRQRLLPLDRRWMQELTEKEWPTRFLPEVLGNYEITLGALIREYLFVSLFKACIESLASENGSRLVAMQRAEKNINDMMDELKVSYYRIRQSNIDNELFDVIAGFESLSKT